MSSKISEPARIKLARAEGEELAEIYRARHDVYATELKQYAARTDGSLPDAGDVHSIYITATIAGRLMGFIGITPPASPRCSVDRYVAREQMPFTWDDGVFEVRALTVLSPSRGSIVAAALMYAAFRWMESRRGRRIVAIGRRDVLGMYLAIGMNDTRLTFSCGAVTYHLLTATVEEIRRRLERFTAALRRMERGLDWRLGISFQKPSECYHGGAFFGAIGDEFDDLRRRDGIINADVLDAWFPPAPAVQEALHEHLEWIVRTSPPTHSEGLERKIAEARGIEPTNVLAGGGSSALIFLALRHWLEKSSRVLLLDPTYGEYAHVLETVVGCRVERFALRREEGYRVEVERLRRTLADGFDLFVWVNPNNPTGRHVPRAVAADLLGSLPARTRVWVDETYIEYVGREQSLELVAAANENMVVCKSISKVYALSGLRAGYLCAPAHVLEELRSLTPPWSVSLAAQIATVAALAATEYYAGCYRETHRLREELSDTLRGFGIREIIPGMANFLMFHLPADWPETATVVAACRQRGLFLRNAGPMGSNLGARALRLAVKDAETNARMIHILSEVLRTQSATQPRPLRVPAGCGAR